MSTLDLLPVILGAGQAMRPVPDDLDAAFGPADLAGEALDRAFADAGLQDRALDVCFGVRLFGDSGPTFPNPFGRSNNFPASVCAHAGASSKAYIYDFVGGQSPQTLVAEAAKLLMDGQAGTVAVVGAEAIANIKAAGRAGATPDWNETREEALEDRGLYPPGPFIVSPQAISHGIAAPAQYYGLFETARRAAFGETKEAYAKRMASIWEGFARVAADNPFAHVRSAPTAHDIVTPGPGNPMINSPYTKAMVARDGVNLGAAVILTTYGCAKAMGRTDVTFLHAHDECTEPTPMERERLDRAEAQRRVLDSVGRDADLYDLYSCFPVVPLEAQRILGLDDGAVMTLTGGLPFFGGPGNNYSLHGIAEAHAAVRGTDKTAVVYANGGLASKHAAGRYSGTPPGEVRLLKSESPAPSVALASDPDPTGRIVSYTVRYKRGEEADVVVVGETEHGARFLALGDVALAGNFVQDDPLDAIVTTRTAKGRNLVTGI
jgi:acetyl-CoA C-acetyltransferase